MNIVCVICSDLLTPSAIAFFTPCGHIFHHVCLTQWLERSKTCPQCRKNTTLQKIHRIYLNFSEADAITDNTHSLQDKVDNLKLELILKEKDRSLLSKKSEALEKETKHLRKELVKIDIERNSTIGALKQQVNYFKEQALEADSMRKENEQLKGQIENYKNIQILLDGSTEEIDEMAFKTCDPNTFATYISVMKREMTISLNKRRDLRSKVKSLQQELTKVTMEKKFLSEEHKKRKKAEEDLMICESEKMALQNKLRELEKLSKRTSISDCNVEDGLSSNAENVSEQNPVKESITNENINVENSKDEKKNVAARSTNEKKDDSPYLPVKSGGMFVLKQATNKKRGIMKTSSSILTKKPRTDQPSVGPTTYNGFGGHAKFDIFSSSSGMKIKKDKNDQYNFKE